MANFREVNTGQIVAHDDAELIAWFTSQARWAETNESPGKTDAEKKAEAAAKRKADAAAKKKAEADKAAETKTEE